MAIDRDPVKVARNARIVASVLDALPPDVEPPTHYYINAYVVRPGISWLIFGDGDGQRERAAAIVRAIGGHWDKSDGFTDYFAFEAERNGVQLRVVVDREQVCRRVVTGTREVTKLVPADDAPMVEVVETVEDFTWECEPLLAEVSS